MDAEGHNYLNCIRFTFCWFQLADRFTSGISAKEYTSFLWGMVNHI
ncbi:unnamed protein product, partial [Discosporangium mesarthrocarpum]